MEPLQFSPQHRDIDLLRVLWKYERAGRTGGVPIDIAAAVAGIAPRYAAARCAAMVESGYVEYTGGTPGASFRAVGLTTAGLEAVLAAINARGGP